MTVLLLCEGAANSLDVEILKRLLKGMRPGYTLVPIGGKAGLGLTTCMDVARNIYTVTLRSKPRAILALRDRDFDQEPPPSLSRGW